MNNKNKYPLLSCTSLSLHLTHMAIALLPLLFVTNAYAAFDPGIIKTGGVDIVPVLVVTEAYDTNVLYSEINEKSSSVTTIKPSVVASVTVGANKYSVAAGAVIGRYGNSTEDNYNDSNFLFDLHQSFTRKFTLDFKAKRMNTHESRGLGYSQGTAQGSLAKPDKYNLNVFDGMLSYGSKDSLGRVELQLYSEAREYETRREIIRTRDRDIMGGDVTFYYHIMPKTSLLFEIGSRELTYIYNASYNSAEKRVLLGATWDMTSLTSGTAKAGMLKKDFDTTLRKSASILSWEVSARWTPLSYSVVDVLTRGKIEETDGNGDYIDSKSVISQWTHFWNSNMQTIVNLNVTKNIYQPAEREDKYASVGFEVKYDFRRWLNAGLGYTFTQNDSSRTNFSFNKNLVSINLMVAL